MQDRCLECCVMTWHGVIQFCFSFMARKNVLFVSIRSYNLSIWETWKQWNLCHNKNAYLPLVTVPGGGGLCPPSGQRPPGQRPSPQTETPLQRLPDRDPPLDRDPTWTEALPPDRDPRRQRPPYRDCRTETYLDRDPPDRDPPWKETPPGQRQ